MLYGLAKQGNAPHFLNIVTKRGVPIVSIAISALATSGGILINYLLDGKALELLMSLVVTTLVINWIMICISNLKFRAVKIKEGIKPKFKALWYPFGNYLCLIFLFLILVIILLTDGIRISVLLMLFWVLFLWIGFLLTKFRKQNRAN